MNISLSGSEAKHVQSYIHVFEKTIECHHLQFHSQVPNHPMDIKKEKGREEKRRKEKKEEGRREKKEEKKGHLAFAYLFSH